MLKGTASNVESTVKRDEIDRQMAELRATRTSPHQLPHPPQGRSDPGKSPRHSRQTGVFYGIAANCGLNFPITNDQGINDYIEKMEGQPCFIGMQAEGREWPTLFSKEAVAKFDYIFSDAMTIVDHRGKRARLWIPEEVDIPDKQAFMELLVRTIEQILDNEPIDIYANPTYLPDVINQGIRHALDARTGEAGDRRGGPQRRGDRDQQPAEAAQGRFHPPGEEGRHQIHARHEQRRFQARPRRICLADDPRVRSPAQRYVPAQAGRQETDPGAGIQVQAKRFTEKCPGVHGHFSVEKIRATSRRSS